MVVIDSDVLIAILRKKPDAGKFISSIKNTQSPATTIINEFELLVGANLSANEDNTKQTEALLSDLTILALDKKAVKKASEIYAYLLKRGEKIEANDVFIAAIAITNNEALLTKNIRHFQRIPGLKIQQI